MGAIFRFRHRVPLLALIVLVARATSLNTLVLDVDEAWFAVSGAVLRHPGDYFLKALDNKPPGTAWFYWVINRLTHAGVDPRPARLILLVWLVAACWLVGRTVTRLERRRSRLVLGLSQRGWFAVVTCLAATALPLPEQLSGTTELIALLPLCFTLWFFTEAAARGSAWGVRAFAGAGIVFGSTLVLKQTAVVFVPLVAAALVWLWHERRAGAACGLAFLAGAALPTLLTSLAVGAGPLWYWSWIYPFEVMRPARRGLFAEGRMFAFHSAVFALACWPLIAGLVARQKRVSGGRLWIGVWSVGGAAAVVMGKGLFFHYFLFLVPPLSAWLALARRPRGLGWLAAGAVSVSLVAAIPQAGILWGTDLVYYGRLGEAIRGLTTKNERVLVWGGNALPLVASGRLPATRFITARYALPSYTTHELQRLFREEFKANRPALVVDVHDRSDDCFDLRPEALDWLPSELERHYEPVAVAGLPWATLYRRRASRLRTVAALEVPKIDEASPAMMPELPASAFLRPDELAAGEVEAWLKLAGNAVLHWRHARALEELVRVWQALGPLAQRGAGPLRWRTVALERAITRETAALGGAPEPGLQAENDRRLAIETGLWVKGEYERRGWPVPLPMTSRAWWAELALVKMQPGSPPQKVARRPFLD